MVKCEQTRIVIVRELIASEFYYLNVRKMRINLTISFSVGKLRKFALLRVRILRTNRHTKFTFYLSGR